MKSVVMRIMDKKDFVSTDKYQMVLKFAKEKISDFRVDERRKVKMIYTPYSIYPLLWC